MTLESQTFRTHTGSIRAGLRTTPQFQLVWNLSYLSHLKLYRECRHLPIQWSRKLHYRTRHLNLSFLGMCKFVLSLSTFKPAVKVTSIRTGTVTYSSSNATISSASWNFTFSPVLDTFSKSMIFQKKYSAATDEITGMYSHFSLTADPVSKLHFCTTHYLQNSLSTSLKFDRTEGLLLKW